jgi:hypothetical protein
LDRIRPSWSNPPSAPGRVEGRKYDLLLSMNLEGPWAVGEAASDGVPEHNVRLKIQLGEYSVQIATSNHRGALQKPYTRPEMPFLHATHTRPVAVAKALPTHALRKYRLREVMVQGPKQT